VYPAPVAIVGVARRTEAIVVSSLADSIRTGAANTAFDAASGQQDAAVGVQELLSDRPAIQQAVAFLQSFPTGYPTGANGFSTGLPSSTLVYAANATSGNFAFALSPTVVLAYGYASSGGLEQFLSFQPTFNLSYTITQATSLTLQDEIAALAGPHGSSGDRLLAAVQQTISPNVVLGAEYGANLLPSPGIAQHDFGIGATIRL